MHLVEDSAIKLSAQRELSLLSKGVKEASREA
jgi:hypothetical protein